MSETSVTRTSGELLALGTDVIEIAGISFKRIEGYQHYFISDWGEIISLKGKLPKMLSDSQDKDGYPRARLSSKTSQKSIHVHRLVCQTYLGSCPSGWQVNHVNGIKTDNRLENLEYCSPRTNTAHARETGLKADWQGESHPTAKLTEENVRTIRGLLQAGNLSQTKVAAMFEVSVGNVNHIEAGRRWSHVGNSPTQASVPVKLKNLLPTPNLGGFYMLPTWSFVDSFAPFFEEVEREIERQEEYDQAMQERKLMLIDSGLLSAEQRDTTAA